jgi:TolA-binding protein
MEDIFRRKTITDAETLESYQKEFGRLLSKIDYDAAVVARQLESNLLNQIESQAKKIEAQNKEIEELKGIIERQKAQLAEMPKKQEPQTSTLSSSLPVQGSPQFFLKKNQAAASESTDDVNNAKSSSPRPGHSGESETQ